jgi:signal transduction histidine kinase
MLPKVLLVDDREDNLMSIEAILGNENYRFVRASSGRMALKVLLQEYDFALILMDVKMPNLNGFETATLIYEREKLRQIPIIFITAHSYSDESLFKGYRAGAVDYIYKPINPELLKAKVSIFIELYQKNNRLLIQEQKLIAINKSLESEINERKLSEAKVKALNLELLKNIDSLEAANKDLDRFAFMASHDLQEPLRKIRTFSNRLLESYGNVLDDEGKMYIDRVQNAAGRMQVLIRDILTFSKISMEPKVFTDTELNALMDGVLEQMEDAITAKQANVVVGKLPRLFVNPALMHALFCNLIGNALKYSKNGETVTVRIYTQTEVPKEVLSIDAARYHRIVVEDNGIGFDQKYAEQIFNMFTRLHNYGEYEGTGIGLALCKKIIEDHNGYIYARGKVNEGAAFVVSIPVDLHKNQVATSANSREMNSRINQNVAT